MHSFFSQFNQNWQEYKGFEKFKLNDLFWQGLLTRWGCEPCRVQLKLDQNNRGRRGKLWLLLLKCFKNTFGSQKSIISFLSCIACFKHIRNPFYFSTLQVLRLHQGDKSFTPAFTIRNRKVFRSFVWPWFWSSCWCVVQCVPYLGRPPGSDQ